MGIGLEFEIGWWSNVLVFMIFLYLVRVFGWEGLSVVFFMIMLVCLDRCVSFLISWFCKLKSCLRKSCIGLIWNVGIFIGMLFRYGFMVMLGVGLMIMVSIVVIC